MNFRNQFEKTKKNCAQILLYCFALTKKIFKFCSSSVGGPFLFHLFWASPKLRSSLCVCVHIKCICLWAPVFLPYRNKKWQANTKPWPKNCVGWCNFLSENYRPNSKRRKRSHSREDTLFYLFVCCCRFCFHKSNNWKELTQIISTIIYGPEKWNECVRACVWCCKCVGVHT